mgnify:CR=1 FL=1
MWLALYALIGTSSAAEHRVFRAEMTIESLAEDLGDPTLADVIRKLNDLDPGEQAEVGSIVMLPSLHADHVDQDAAVLSWSGDVEIQTPGSARVPAAVGASLPPGSVVCTLSDGFATIRLAISLKGRFHDDLSLLPDTCLTVTSTFARSGARGSLVSVDSGSISVRAAEDEPGAITVVTPSGVTSGDAGGFRVTIEDNAARTEAVGAPTTVFGAGAEVAVDTGYGSRVRTGEAPSDAVKLLEPGAPASPDNGASLRRADFTWTPVERALGYRIELSAAPDFSDVIRIEDVPAAEWRPERLFLPYRIRGLWWRIASFDRTGFQGAFSEARTLALPGGVGP